ncbi:MAG: TonB-dependent receptor [Rhizobacter sp.]|nr:TonB-dependent receptor [Chlorobiales bacterium]
MHRVFLSLFLPLIFSLSLASLSLATAANASGTLEGKVVDSKSREAMAGVSVVVKGTPFGDATNLQGFFSIPNLTAGTYTLQATFLGYETLTRDIIITDGQTTRLDFSMKESSVAAKEVEVVAGKQRQEQADPRTSVFRIEPRQAKIQAGAIEDVLRALQAVPGVLAQNDFSSQLFVRGSGPDQNLMLMDDIEVFNPYRLYGTISMFNPETVADVSLITGGFPAKYGDRLSAVLDISNRDGTKERPLAVQLNANITDANLVAEGKSPFGLNGSWLFSARRTYYDLIVGPILRSANLVDRNVAFPNFVDFQGRLAFQLAPEHRLQFIGVIGRDAVDIISTARTAANPDSINVGNTTNNDVLGAAWHYRPNENTFNKLTASWYRNSGDSRLGGAFADRLNFSDEDLEDLPDSVISRLAAQVIDSKSSFAFVKSSLRNDFGYKLPRHQLETGAGVDLLSTSIYFLLTANADAKALYNSQIGQGVFGAIPIDSTVEQSRGYYRFNVYAQDKFELVEKKLFVQPGLRFDYYAIISKPYLSPRFNFSYAVDGLTTLRGAWGIYYQSPGYEKLIDQAAQGQLFDLSQNSEFITSLKAERAIHYVLGLERWLDDRWQVKAEVYYKVFNDLIVQKKQTVPEYETRYLGGDPYQVSSWEKPFQVTRERLSTTAINDGSGAAYGVELLLEKRITTKDDRLSGWASYALAYANRYRDGLTIPFTYDQRHTINFVGQYEFNDWLAGSVRWRYGSGFPYTAPVGATPRIVELSEGEAAISTASIFNNKVAFNRAYGDETNVNATRYPDYHRLDIRFTAKAAFWSAQWEFYLDVINVYNRTNVVAYQYDITPNPNGGVPVLTPTETGMLPIVPTLGFSAIF